VHAVVDGGVERRQDVRVEALAAVHGWEAHTVAAPRARGALPVAVPSLSPNTDASGTGEPTAVDSVCVPCPSVSRGLSVDAFRAPPAAAQFPTA
jgi:hypothetical protein